MDSHRDKRVKAKVAIFVDEMSCSYRVVSWCYIVISFPVPHVRYRVLGSCRSDSSCLCEHSVYGCLLVLLLATVVVSVFACGYLLSTTQCLPAIADL